MVLADQRTCPPSLCLCSFITLITYQFSLLLFACVLPAFGLRVSLRLPTLAPRTLLAYQHTWSSFFEPLFVPFTLPPIVFDFFYQSCFTPPPSPLSPIFHFPLPFSPSRLASASLLLCLLVLFVASVSLWSYGWVGLKGKVCVPVSHTQSLSTIPGHRQSSTCAEPFPPIQGS